MHLGQKTPDPMPFRIRRVPQSADQKADALAADSVTLAEKQGSKAVSHRATGWLLFSEWRNEEHASVGFNK